MKQLSIITYLFIVLLSVGSFSFAQPEISRDENLANMPTRIQVLIQKLYSSSAVERAKAAVALRTEKLAIPFLVAMLGDDTDLVWSSSYGTGGSPTSPGFEAAKALSTMGDTAVPALIVAMTDKDPIVRQNAAIALLWIGEANGPKSLAPAVDSLIIALEDKSHEVRWRAAWALRDMGWRPTDQKSLISFLILAQEWEELSRIGKPAVASLIVALKDKDWSRRSGASRTLGMIGDISAVEPLIEALKDEIPDVRKIAAVALTKLTGQDFGQNDVKWLKWWEQNKGEFLKTR